MKGLFSESDSNFHSAPRRLEISELCIFGFSRAIFLLWILDHTIKAFMGRFTCSSDLEVVVVVVLDADDGVRDVAGEAAEGVSRDPSSERLNIAAVCGGRVPLTSSAAEGLDFTGRGGEDRWDGVSVLNPDYRLRQSC